MIRYLFFAPFLYQLKQDITAKDFFFNFGQGQPLLPVFVLSKASYLKENNFIPKIQMNHVQLVI